MSLMERVREIGAAENEVSEQTVAVARRTLMNEVTRATRPARARRRRRAWAGVGIGSLAAGTAATAIVVGSVVAPPSTPSASAAEVFERAAEAAATGEPALAPGEYLRVETSFSWIARWDAEMPDGARFNNGDPDDAEAALQIEETVATYVPADHDDDWIRERSSSQVVATYGSRVRDAATEWEQFRPSDAHAGVTRYPGGVAQANGGDGGTFEYRLDGADEYADLPTDVAGVIAWFAERYAGEGDANDLGHYFVETISDLAVFDLAPGKVRSAMLNAFATLDGVDVLRQDGDVTTLRYERRNSDGESAPIDFTLDLAHGYVLEVTSWPYGADPSVDDGAPEWASRTVAEISVVDSAP